MDSGHLLHAQQTGCLHYTQKAYPCEEAKLRRTSFISEGIVGQQGQQVTAQQAFSISTDICMTHAVVHACHAALHRGARRFLHSTVRDEQQGRHLAT